MKWEVICNGELNDGIIDCENVESANQKIVFLLDDSKTLLMMNETILMLHAQKHYLGACKTTY